MLVLKLRTLPSVHNSFFNLCITSEDVMSRDRYLIFKSSYLLFYIVNTYYRLVVVVSQVLAIHVFVTCAVLVSIKTVTRKKHFS
jgi:hypothetical protein